MSVTERLAETDLQSISEDEWEELRVQLRRSAKTEEDQQAIYRVGRVVNDRFWREADEDEWGQRPVMERVRQLREHMEALHRDITTSGTVLHDEMEVLPVQLLRVVTSPEALSTLALSYRIKARQCRSDLSLEEAFSLHARMFTAVALGYNGVHVLKWERSTEPLPEDVEGEIIAWYGERLEACHAVREHCFRD